MIKKGKKPREGENRCENMKMFKNLCEEKGEKGAHMYSMNTSVGVQNRVRIWRTIDSRRKIIKETTRVC